MPSPEETIKNFEPIDYKSQALTIANGIDELMEKKGVKGFLAVPPTFEVGSIEELIENLNIVYHSLARLPDYPSHQPES